MGAEIDHTALHLLKRPFGFRATKLARSSVAQEFGRYQLLKKLAVGGMGQVYLARQKGLSASGFEKLVVVKVLLPHLNGEQDFINMFFDEARIAALLNHPNIAQIYDLGEVGGTYFIAMEYVHGENLRQVAVDAVDKLGKVGMPLALKCRVIADAAAALDFAHRAKSPAGQPLGLIHRDVSPQNVIVGFSGAVKLIDFGVAKASGKLARTATGVIKGKYAYMSPEQARGEELDSRSDIFGLGTVFHELLVNERLFKHDQDIDTLRAVVGLKIQLPSSMVKGLPKALDSIVMKALERDRNKRYQTAGELALALEEFLVKQRLPATGAHLSAFMADLYPQQVAQEALQSETTESNSDAVSGFSPVGQPVPPPPPAPSKPPPPKKNTALDPRELEARINGTTPEDHVRGLFFNAVYGAVLRTHGAKVEPALKAALHQPREWVEQLGYPTAEFLRLLWKSVELMAQHAGGASEAFFLLGEACLEAMVRSPLGAPLEALPASNVQDLLKPILKSLEPMLAPGRRLVSESTARSATIVFKEDVLPVQLYEGFLGAALERKKGIRPKGSFEKTAADRVELKLTW
jgi:eukaryotic-like serine/threonine-protein kinase